MLAGQIGADRRRRRVCEISSSRPARLGLRRPRAPHGMEASRHKHGFAVQAPLAIIGFLLGLVAWWQTGHWTLAVGRRKPSSANWPYTGLGIMPNEPNTHRD